MPIFIEGKNPLRGSINVSGARNSAVKLLFASMFSNQDIMLHNVPRVESINTDIEIVKSIGGKAEWIGSDKLLLNGSDINSYQIPYPLGSKYRESFLLVGPLLFRFGKASIPQTLDTYFKPSPINRILNTWKSLGFEVTSDDRWFNISGASAKSAEISFRTSTHTGTENAIMSAMFIEGETIINNASEESEIEDLIEFCNMMGAQIDRLEPRKLKVIGTNVFKGGTFSVQPDKYEAAAFATAAILTGGNVSITGINKMALVPFVNYLAKINVNFEIQENELRVWESPQMEPCNITISPSPGFIPNWQPLVVLNSTKAVGDSLVHDAVYTDKFGYIQDLNRIGANIELLRPSTQGITPIISDDDYDFEKLGEPLTLAIIHGPSKFHAEKFHITDPRFANVLVLAGLAAEGRTEINGYISIHELTERFFDKLISLGAKISKTDDREPTVILPVVKED